MANHSPVGSQHHIVPVKTYLVTWLILLVLMSATIAASYVQLPGVGNNIVALIIATIKAVLVVMVFMGVKYSTKLVKIWAMIGFIWVTFIFGILIDYATRIPVSGFNSDFSTTVPRKAEVAGQPSPPQDQSTGYVAPTDNPKLKAQLGQ